MANHAVVVNIIAITFQTAGKGCAHHQSHRLEIPAGILLTPLFTTAGAVFPVCYSNDKNPIFVIYF